MTHSFNYKLGECWSLVNEIEGEWTGMEERDRSIISKLVQVDLGFLITVCLLRNTITKN